LPGPAILAVCKASDIPLAPSHKGPCLATRQVFRGPPLLPSTFFNWLPLHLRCFLFVDAVCPAVWFSMCFFNTEFSLRVVSTRSMFPGRAFLLHASSGRLTESVPPLVGGRCWAGRMRFLTRHHICYQRRSYCCAPCSPPPCFEDGQRISTCVLTGPLVSHAPTSVACALGSVACVYFCRMHLVYIELSEPERTGGFSTPLRYAPRAAALVLYLLGTSRADSRRSRVGLAPGPQALPIPATALILYIY
jgi:hypothetical protein